MSDPSFDRTILKKFFVARAKPTEPQFAALIESCLNRQDDNIFPDRENQRIGIGTTEPEATLDIKGEAPSLRLRADAGGASILLDQPLGREHSSSIGFVREGQPMWRMGIGLDPLNDRDKPSLSFMPPTGEEPILQLTSDGRVGIHTSLPDADFHVRGNSIFQGDIQISPKQEILFFGAGQIRSADDNHRILFRSDENKLELRERGDIVLSSGARNGQETGHLTLTANGDLIVKNSIQIGSIRGPAIRLTASRIEAIQGSLTLHSSNGPTIIDGDLKVNGTISDKKAPVSIPVGTFIMSPIPHGDGKGASPIEGFIPCDGKTQVENPGFEELYSVLFNAAPGLIASFSAQGPRSVAKNVSKYKVSKIPPFESTQGTKFHFYVKS